MSNVTKNRLYVATYAEVFYLLVFFIVLLFVLYPKDFLYKQVLAEKANYDLSIVYLENMLQSDPENENVMLRLSKLGLHTGKRGMAKELLILLQKSKTVEIKKEAYTLSYTLMKEDLYFIDDLDKKKAQRLKLQGLLHEIVDKEYYALDEIEKWYLESKFLNDYDNGLLLLQKQLKQRPNDTVLLETIAQHYIAQEKYLKGSQAYMNLYNRGPKYSKKRYYFLQAIQALQFGSLHKQSVALAYAYEDQFLHDTKVRKRILKLYISTGNLHRATSFSRKLMRK